LGYRQQIISQSIQIHQNEHKILTGAVDIPVMNQGFTKTSRILNNRDFHDDSAEIHLQQAGCQGTHFGSAPDAPR
jgi:hypothetical protein